MNPELSLACSQHSAILVLILSKTISFHVVPSYFLTIHFNIVLSPTVNGDSLVGIATQYELDGSGIESRTALGPTQPAGLFLGDKAVGA